MISIEERGACELLTSACDYLSRKSYVGDEALYFCPSSQWMKNITEAIRHLKECTSLIRLLAGKESLCTTQK